MTLPSPKDLNSIGVSLLEARCYTLIAGKVETQGIQVLVTGVRCVLTPDEEKYAMSVLRRNRKRWDVQYTPRGESDGYLDFRKPRKANSVEKVTNEVSAAAKKAASIASGKRVLLVSNHNDAGLVRELSNTLGSRIDILLGVDSPPSHAKLTT